MKKESRAVRKMNVKAILGTLGILAGLVVVGVFAATGLKGQVRKAVLDQVTELQKQHRADLALRHLQQYLEKNPQDAEVLEVQARLLYEGARSYDQFLGTADTYARLLRLEPASKDAREWKLRQAEMLIRYSEFLRAAADNFVSNTFTVKDDVQRTKFPAAEVVLEKLYREEKLAKKLEDGKPLTPEEGRLVRLYANALEGQMPATKTSRTDWAQILDFYKAALQVDPKDTESSLRLAKIYLDRIDSGPDHPEADEFIQAMIDADPDSATTWLKARAYYLQCNKADRATEALRRAVELAKKDDYLVQYEYISDRIANRDFDKAREILDSLPKEARESPKALRLEGLIARTQGDVDKAIQIWQDALIKSRSSDVDLMWLLANAYLESKRLTEAAKLIDEFERIGSTMQPMIGLLEGLLAEKQGKPGQAIDQIGKVVSELQPELQVVAHQALARCEAAQGNGAAAERYYAEARKLDSGDGAPALREIDQLLRTGKSDQAMSLLKTASDGGDETALGIYARLLIARQAALPAGDRDWSEFDRVAARVKENSPTAYFLAIQRALVDERNDAAVAKGAEAVKAHPKSPELWANYAEAVLRSGVKPDMPRDEALEVRKAQTEKALAILEQAMRSENAGENAGFRIARAELLTTLGRGSEAMNLLSYALADLPTADRVQLLAARGRMATARGDIAGARDAYSQWARIQQGAPEPVLSQLQLAIAVGDDGECRRILAELGRGSKVDPLSSSPSDSVTNDLARAEYMLRMPLAGPDRLANALTLASHITQKNPALAPALLLEARILDLESRKDSSKLPDAITAFRNALAAGARDALPQLVIALAREGNSEAQINDLVKPSMPFDNYHPWRLAAEVYLQSGKKDLAAKYLDKVLANIPPSDAVESWKISTLDRLGRQDEVEAAMIGSLEKNPQNLSGQLALLRYQLARGEKDAARQTMDRMLAQAQPDTQPLLRAMSLEALGDIPGAEKAFQAALAARPGHAETMLAASRFFDATARPEQARKLLEDVVAREPSNRPAARLLALHLSGGTNVTADSWAKAMAALGPEPTNKDRAPAEDRIVRAIVLARNPDPARRAEALPLLESLVADQPAAQTMAAAARETLVKLLMANQKYERASEIAAVTATSMPSAPGIALYVEALLNAKNFGEASRQLDRLTALATDRDSVAQFRVRLLEGESKPDELPARLMDGYKELAATPDGPYFGAAVVKRLLRSEPKRDKEALAIAQDMAKRHPGSSWVLAQLEAASGKDDLALAAARVAIAEGNAAQVFEGARAILPIAQKRSNAGESLDGLDSYFDEAIARQPNLPGLKSVVGMFRHLQGDYPAEIQAYRDLLQSDMNNPLYNNNLAWALCEGAHQPEEALRYIDIAIRALGRLPELLDTRGVILTRLKRYDEAIRDLSDTVARNPSPVYLFHLARAYQLAGQVDKAKATLAQATQAGLTPATVEPFERPELETLSKL